MKSTVLQSLGTSWKRQLPKITSESKWDLTGSLHVDMIKQQHAQLTEVPFSTWGLQSPQKCFNTIPSIINNIIIT